MLYRVMGSSGSGKTEILLSHLGEMLKKRKKCFVIVPEQQSVAYESAIVERFGDESNLYCEVLNFERLPNRVARDFGGLAVNAIDKGASCALLSLVTESLRDELCEYATVASDTDFAASLFSLISKMKMSLVTPAALNSALESGNIEDSRLWNKLSDIAKIYSAFENCFSDEMSDPRDALTRLGDELTAKPFFKASAVFVDGYYTFTEQEYAILGGIISQSDDTWVSFTLDPTRSFFAENAKSADRVRKLSKSGIEDIWTEPSSRGKTESLRFVEKNIWRTPVTSLSGSDDSVRLVTAKNRFDEVEAAASEILSFVRAGGRYRDITVLAGNVDAYSAIVDSVFGRADIPCYLSAKEALSMKPLFAFLLSSLSVVIEDFSLSSMKRYIKSGYTDLSVSEIDALLSYATSWNLRGKAWYRDEDWTLNPEGYREGDLSKRGAKLLALANQARRKIIPALSALHDTLKQKNLTVSSAVRALYFHMMSLSADEKLRLSAERALLEGDREKSERELALWKLLIDIINKLDSICGDREVTPKRLLSLIRLMCDSYSLGAIPPSADSVTFGDASLIRAGGSRLVIILGAVDGEFPASTRASFFDRYEAVMLEDVGLTLADTVEKTLNTNRFFVYAALSAPTEQLVMLCPRSEIGGEELRPSQAWLSLKTLLPDIIETEFSGDDFIYSRESVASHFPSMSESPLRDRIELALTDKMEAFFCESPSVCEPTSRIDFSSNELLLSPSKFERYVLCPFSFFANYLLDLKEKKLNEFSSPEIGTYVHKILEEFVRSRVIDGRFVAPDPAERKLILEQMSDEYFDSVIGDEAKKDKRFVHTFENMKKTIDFVAKSICDEFSSSKFVPTGFEFKIGLKNPDIPAIEFESDGKKTLLRGSIDRVDTYVHDGIKYVRVVDYKTYTKPFSLSMVESGLDTQLLHYLFAYCEKTGSKPAGALYYTVRLPEISVTGRETREEMKQAIDKSLKRSGILIDDPDIVLAMSPDCAYVPTSLNRDGTLSKRSKNLLTDEEFGALSDNLHSQIARVSDDVFGGKMDIAPNDLDGKADPCLFCPNGDFCRKGKKREEDADESD